MADKYLHDGGGNVAPYESYANAATTLNGLIAGTTVAVSEKIWVDSAHAESSATSLTLASPASATILAPQQVLSVSDPSSTPPTTLSYGAKISVTGNYSLSITGNWYFYGFQFEPGASSPNNNSYVILGPTTSGPQLQIYENCLFNSPNVNQLNFVRVGNSANSGSDGAIFIFKNCTFNWGHASKRIVVNPVVAIFDNMILSGSATPTSLFTTSADQGNIITIKNSDLTGLAWTNFMDWGTSGGTFLVQNCKMPSSWVGAINPYHSGEKIIFINCSSASGDNIGYRAYYYSGAVTTDTSVYWTTGGMTDGTTAHSLKMASNANCSRFNPLRTEWMQIWKSASQTSIDVDVVRGEASAAALTNAELWLEWEYMDTTNYPQSGRYSTAPANILTAGSSIADASAGGSWTGEPATPMTHTLTTGNFTPSLAGYVRYRVCFAVASKIIYCNLRQG